jgi:hypothetical protein
MTIIEMKKEGLDLKYLRVRNDRIL